MAPEKQAVKYCLLGEAADDAALFLLGRKNLEASGSPPLRTLLCSPGVSPKLRALQGFCSLTALSKSQVFGTSCCGQLRALPSKLLNSLVLVGPG